MHKTTYAIDKTGKKFIVIWEHDVNFNLHDAILADYNNAKLISFTTCQDDKSPVIGHIQLVDGESIQFFSVCGKKLTKEEVWP